MSKKDRKPTTTESQVEYRTIPGYPKYEAGSDGTILSHKRKQQRHLSASSNRDGYMAVTTCVDGVSRNVSVHKLVLLAFRGERPVGMEACHNNGDRSDNRIENLRWDTPSNNCKDRAKHGRWNYAKGERIANSIITVAQARDIAMRSASGESNTSIARDMGLKRVTVSAVATGRNWSHATGITR